MAFVRYRNKVGINDVSDTLITNACIYMYIGLFLNKKRRTCLNGHLSTISAHTRTF